MPGIEFAAVARALDCETFARQEMEMRGNRAKCPFSPGETRYNLQFFPDGRCHCHACHKGGDVIFLAAAVWGLNQMEAARLLNEEFRLGIKDSSGPTAAERETRAKERAAREAEKAADRAAWCAAADNLREAEAALEHVSMEDAEKAGTWEKIVRLARAQDTWESLQAAQTAGR